MTSRLSSVYLLCFFVLGTLIALLPTLRAQPMANVGTRSADPTYDEGVATYTEAAAKQLGEIRKAIDAKKAATVEEDRDQFDDVYKRMAECDNLLAQLKRSPRSSFDGNKKKFEDGLGRLIKEIGRTEKT